MILRKLLSLLWLLPGLLAAQEATLSGLLIDEQNEPIIYANVALYQQTDSSLVKVETTDETGAFRFVALPAQTYWLEATYVGMQPLQKNDIVLGAGQTLDVGRLTFANSAVELAEALVTADRALVEVKPDRTVFNVEGTINSAGNDGLALLRMAPGVTVDNNNSISVLGRSGVLLYVDGKRLPLTGEDLTNYLQNLTAEQIDRIDIITNPGARYEAEGNAGIIDIRLKRDKNMGTNGSVSVSSTQGRYNRSNINANLNYRNRGISFFSTAGANRGAVFNNMSFLSFQNGLQLDEIVRSRNDWQGWNARAGLDFYIGKQHTIGALVSVRDFAGDRRNFSRVEIGPEANPLQIDSLLVARNDAEDLAAQATYNLNYRFDNGEGSTLNIDADYGAFRNDRSRLQPNQYFDAGEMAVQSEVINFLDTPTDIDIYTLKADYATDLAGGKLGLGSKVSQVVTDNTFLFYDVIDNANLLSDTRSNTFEYDERVYAGYLNYDRALGEKFSFTAGLRMEHTDATGDLRAFLPELQEPPVELVYTSWFPNAGITWQASPQSTLALNYGRRINRPDYNVLNPFENQLSQISYEKGNPFLRPEIVNNIELGYTLAYRYNFKLAYSRTTDQITRLISPDDEDVRAGFITWDNLAEQKIWSFNVSAPVQISKGWNAYFNGSGSYLDNQADYGNDGIVDVQAWTYNIYQQHTIDLPAGFKGEVSGWFSGPGVWGGVFRYETSWSLNVGLQRKFFGDKLNVKLNANDLFYESGWDGFSEFNGLLAFGSGRWDSRQATLSLSYNFGNENVKRRQRNTGLEEESQRVGN